MRKFWILLAAATIAVIYLAVTPGGPLSVNPRADAAHDQPHAQSTMQAPARTPDANGDKNIATEIDTAMTNAQRQSDSGQAGIGRTIDQVLGLLDDPASEKANS